MLKDVSFEIEKRRNCRYYWPQWRRQIHPIANLPAARLTPAVAARKPIIEK
jgi:hypothetical protein